MVSIPKSISIGGHTIAVEVVRDLPDWGEYSADTKVIRLRKSTARTMIETLRHEMIHAAFDIGGLSYLDGLEEEALVRCLDSLFWPSWDGLENQS